MTQTTTVIATATTTIATRTKVTATTAAAAAAGFMNFKKQVMPQVKYLYSQMAYIVFINP